VRINTRLGTTTQKHIGKATSMLRQYVDLHYKTTEILKGNNENAISFNNSTYI